MTTSVNKSTGIRWTEFQQIYNFPGIFHLHPDPKIKKSGHPDFHLFI